MRNTLVNISEFVRLQSAFAHKCCNRKSNDTELRLNTENSIDIINKISSSISREQFAVLWKETVERVSSSNGATYTIAAAAWLVIYALLKQNSGPKPTNVYMTLSFFSTGVVILYLHTWLIGYVTLLCTIIFQSEVRRAVKIAQQSLYREAKNNSISTDILNELHTAIEYLSENKIGALICIENADSLEEYVRNGTSLNARISSQLLISIFMKNSPLHDMAVIVQGDKISGAGCLLPLSQSNDIPKNFGTRHRSAKGLSEVTDALILIVSEETGDRSIVRKNQFRSHLSREEFLQLLETEIIAVR